MANILQTEEELRGLNSNLIFNFDNNDIKPEEKEEEAEEEVEELNKKIMKIRQRSRYHEKKGIKLIDPRINKDKRKEKKEISAKSTKILHGKRSRESTTKESNIKNICRNYLAIPQFKGLKKLTIEHCIYICYYLVTVLSLRNRIRNIFNERQMYLVQVFWNKLVPDFLREFGTLTKNVTKFGDELELKDTLNMIKNFIKELTPENKEILIKTFEKNMKSIKYIYTCCHISYFYQTSPDAVNTRLEVDNFIRELRRGKIVQPPSEKNEIKEILLSKRNNVEVKTKAEYEHKKPKNMSEELLLKLRPMEQKIKKDNDLIWT